MTRMSAKFLVDTNILVYAYDRSEPLKLARAQELLSWLEGASAGALSTQILGEFFNTATRKLSTPLPLARALSCPVNYVRSWRTFDITPQIVLEAGRGSSEHQLSYWDAQIWATAKLNQIPVILSEDLGHRRPIDGVAFSNPFTGKIPGEE